jgi:hypothetical protein
VDYPSHVVVACQVATMQSRKLLSFEFPTKQDLLDHDFDPNGSCDGCGMNQSAWRCLHMNCATRLCGYCQV